MLITASKIHENPQLDSEKVRLQVMQAAGISKSLLQRHRLWKIGKYIWSNLVEMEKLIAKNGAVKTSRMAAPDSSFEEPEFIKPEVFQENRANLNPEDWCAEWDFYHIGRPNRRHDGFGHL